MPATLGNCGFLHQPKNILIFSSDLILMLRVYERLVCALHLRCRDWTVSLILILHSVDNCTALHLEVNYIYTAQAGSTMLVLSVASWVLMSESWIIVLLSI